MSTSMREKWTIMQKETLARLLTDGTDFNRRIDEAKTNSGKFAVWVEISQEFCAHTNREYVEHQKLRDLWKKENVKTSKKRQRIMPF